MRQILQHLRTGEMELAELPVPRAGRGEVLIRTRRTIISPGTERMLVEFSEASLLAKARQQPERVRQVLDKIRSDGLLPTLEAIYRRLDEPLPLGYCNAGVVLEVGDTVHDLDAGDRVVSNGPHAEIVVVPRNLCARIPETVDDEAAAFTVLGSIALQGLRLAAPSFGETFIVFGMGLLGLLTVQLLRANGCRVLAVDLDSRRVKLAEELGAWPIDLSVSGDPVAAAHALTHGVGVDGALITASAESHEIVHQAAQACRRRGRIVLVGVTGLNLQRSDFYEKELSFQVSCSYGPGRYDERYERQGQDYPIGFVRWTEQRNFEAVLQAMAEGALDTQSLITHRFGFDDALSAYDAVKNEPSALGIVLEYPRDVELARTLELRSLPSPAAGQVVAGLIGAGSFASAVTLPALAATTAQLAWVATRSQAAAAGRAARKFGAARATTDHREILRDPAVNTVLITVGHELHATLVAEALAAGKHVFVEKPLAIDEAGLARVRAAVEAAGELQLAVGFNRRFSPHVQKAAELLLGRSEPLAFNMTVNAGAVPAEHWVHDPERGGGRIVGEACHFVDLLSFLAQSPVASVSAVRMGPTAALRDDKLALTLGFADGSIGTLGYFASGASGYPKETLEIFSEGRVLRIENFRRTRGFGFGGFSGLRTLRQDKGHRALIAAFVQRVSQGGEPLMPFAGLENVTRACLAAVSAAREGRTIRL